jgi:hypothetical protein
MDTVFQDMLLQDDYQTVPLHMESQNADTGLTNRQLLLFIGAHMSRGYSDFHEIAGCNHRTLCSCMMLIQQFFFSLRDRSDLKSTQLAMSLHQLQDDHNQ